MAFDLQIHRLTPADTELLSQLNAMFAKAFDDERSYGRAPPEEGYVRDVLAQNHVIALVGLTEGVVVGGLVAYELPKLEQARSEVYLYDLAVAETWRRRGIATRLIRHLRSLAHGRGAWVVFVQADRGDDAAISLYERSGKREEVLHFDLPVP